MPHAQRKDEFDRATRLVVSCIGFGLHAPQRKTPEHMAQRILVVDDDRDTREILTLLFSSRGYVVDTAADGAQGLALARSGQAPCAILLDLMMPVMDGESFRRAQLDDARLRHVPVVCISGRYDVERTSAALRFHGWFSKPLPFQHLLSAVESICPPGGGCAMTAQPDPA
jgi:CheY-like chemotaxis protein